MKSASQLQLAMDKDNKENSEFVKIGINDQYVEGKPSAEQITLSSKSKKFKKITKTQFSFQYKQNPCGQQN